MPIVATALLELIHTPPVVGLLCNVVVPSHSAGLPVMAGIVLTVTVALPVMDDELHAVVLIVRRL